MQVTSLAYRTDLGLLRLGGTLIEDLDDHLVVRSPHNPGFWWGNFLLLRGIPAPRDVPRWLERFGAAFPQAGHVAIGFDVIAGAAGDLAAFGALGFDVVVDTVLTASSIDPPARPGADVECRQLSSADDWARSVELRMACHDRREPEESYRAFVQAQAETSRGLVAGGHGAWWGAFAGDDLVAQMGLIAAAPGVARFQAVETHPDHRRRGAARALLHRACAYGFSDLAAEYLVMVADPDYVAIDLYRDVGFAPTETQLRVERPPTS